MREEQRHHRDDQADEQAADHPAHTVAGDDEPVRQWRHQQLLNVLAEFRAEKRGHHVGIRVGDHLHHDQARRDELHVIVAADLPDATADQAAEYDEIKGRGDRRRYDRLAPYAHDPVGLADQDRLESDPVSDGAGDRRHDAFFAPASTRRTKSSSRRLTLLRMLPTSMPWAVSWAKISLRLCLFVTSISSVWLSGSLVAKPGI